MGIVLEQPPLDNPTSQLQQWFHKLWLLISGGSMVPSGSIFGFGGTAAPTGYLICDGSAVSRTTYADLFAAIGEYHGHGDGSTTFNVPDYRGRFLRGVDNSAGNDPDKASRTAMATGGNTGNNVGSVQGHAFQTHNHSDTGHTHQAGLANQGGVFAGNAQLGTSGNTFVFANGGSVSAGNINTASAAIANASASGSKAQATSNETRPVNAYVNFIIKT